MIRTSAFALTVLSFCAPALHAHEPEQSRSNESNIQQNEKQRPHSADSPSRFRQQRSQVESEFYLRLRDALSATVDLEARAAMQQQLNGTWRYVTAIEHDSIETYEDRDVQLVIHNELCGVFEEGTLSSSQPERFRFLMDSDPIVYTRASEQMQRIRFGKRIGTQYSFGLLKVDGNHLMVTSTPAIPNLGYMSYGNSFPDFFDGVDQIDPLYLKYIPYLFPNSFSPERTKNRQGILRRVSDSTELLDRAANLKPDGVDDPLKLTQMLRMAREQEDWLKQVHLKIEARVSSLNSRAQLAPHTNETLQKAINRWREKHSRTDSTDPTVFRDLIEALAASPDQNHTDGIPLTVDLEAGKSVTRLGKEIIAVTDGELSVYIDRQQGADTLFKRGDRIPHHQLSDFRFSLETIPYKATRSYTAGMESHPVGKSAVRVHLKQPPPTPWRPSENIPWAMRPRRSERSGTVSGVYSRNLRSVDSPGVRKPAPPPPPLPVPLPPSPPDLLTYRYNTETKLVDDFKDYAEYAPGDLFRYKAFSFDAVKVEQPPDGEDASPVWFPRYFIEVFYKSGIPHEFIVRKIESVTLESSREMSTVATAKAGETLILIRKNDWAEWFKLQDNVSDVVAHARRIMHADDEK